MWWQTFAAGTQAVTREFLLTRVVTGFLILGTLFASLLAANIANRAQAMSNTIDPFGIHSQALALRSRRAEVLATNLANADTPGYQARDLDFAAVLAEQGDHGALRVSDVRHLGGIDPGFEFALRYREPLQASLDNNTVDVQAERAAFTDNAMRYQASLTFLNGRIRGLMSALRGE